MRAQMPMHFRFMKVLLKSRWTMETVDGLAVVTPCYVDAACGAALLQKGLAWAARQGQDIIEG